MKQVTIQTATAALTVSEKAIDGATRHGAALGITRNTAAAITADRNAFLAERALANAARDALKADRIARDAQLVTVRRKAVLTRDYLKPHLGAQHNSSWISAGFQSSLMVPRNPDKVLLVLGSLVEYLTGNPTLENEPAGLTAEALDLMRADLLASNNGVKAKGVSARNAVAARATKFRSLQKRIRDLIKELEQVMHPLDPRWLDFGLNRPGALVTPEKPQKLSPQVMNGTSVIVKWEASPRTEYYRVWKKVVDVDDDFVPVGTTSDLDFLIENLPAGKEVQIQISAVNNGGESLRSEIAKVTMPASVA